MAHDETLVILDYLIQLADHVTRTGSMPVRTQEGCWLPTTCPGVVGEVYNGSVCLPFRRRTVAGFAAVER